VPISRPAAGPARKSAITISLPDLAPLVDRWRIATVPVASRGVEPHVTLLYPWRNTPLSPSDLGAARAALASVPPFVVTLDGLGRFPGVLFLRPEPNGFIWSLIRLLADAFPGTPPYGGLFPDPVPHLTVAMAATEEALDRLEAEVTQAIGPRLPISFEVRGILVKEEGESGIWSDRARLPLVGPTSADGSS